MSNASVSYKLNPLYYYVPVARKKFNSLNTFLYATIDGSVKISIQKPYAVTLHFKQRVTSPQHIQDGFPFIVKLKGSNNLTI